MAVAAAIACVAILLPFAYLVVRVAEDGGIAVGAIITTRSAVLLARTLAFGAVVTGGAILVGVPLAWITTRTNLAGRRVWTIVHALPLAIPTYVAAYAFLGAYAPRGLVYTLGRLIAPIAQLPDLTGFFGAAFVLTCATYPYVFLATRASLIRLDPSFEEAARGLGLSPGAVFRRVIVPWTRPAIASGALIVALYAISDFGAVALLRVDTFSRAIYLQYQASFDRAAAAALALVLAGLAMAVVELDARTRTRARYFRIGSGASRPGGAASLGRWQVPAQMLLGAVALFSLGIPLAVLAYWAITAIRFQADFGRLLTASVGSLQAASLTAIVATLAAAPIAIVSARSSGRFGALIERTSYLGYALPGIVVALSLVFFAANYAFWLYQSLGLLVFAYTIRHLPQAVGTLRAVILQVNPHTEEAARSLGRSAVGAWRDVVLPVVWPGIWTGAALVFLTTMKELPATLLLSPTGYRTLAVLTWQAASEGFFAEAAIPAFILVVASIPPLAILLRGESSGRPVGE
ncbi:MAG: iron ABC transporter permease [Chloroflexota bacterium]|nr:MAG: iron ABC transporter permease [Chloroflexota bacterium]